MSRLASSTLKAASKPALKSPLHASTMSPLAHSPAPEVRRDGGAEPLAPEITARRLRQMQISESSAWLRTQTNKHKRPFQEETIRGYAEAAAV